MKTLSSGSLRSIALAIIAIVVSTLLASPAYAFKIVIDANQVTSTEAGLINSTNPFYGVDGVWIYKDSTTLTNTEWNTLISDLNGSSLLISEDAFVQESTTPFNTNSYSFLTSTLSKTVHKAMVYIGDDAYSLNGWPQTNILRSNSANGYDQINRAYVTCGNTPLIVLTRAYYNNGVDQRKYYMDLALAESEVGGAVIEFNPVAYTSQYNRDNYIMGGGVDSLEVIDFIYAVLSAGKDCFVLLPPNTTETNYYQSIVDTFHYMAYAQGSLKDPANTSQSLLRSNKLHIVLAAYDTSTNDVDFLGYGTYGYNNSVLAAKAGLYTYRLYGSY